MSVRGRELVWRYTAEHPKFMGLLDSRAMLPFLLVIFHPRGWTLQLAALSTLVFAVLSLWRITPVEGVKAAFLWAITLGFRATHVGHRRRRVSTY